MFQTAGNREGLARVAVFVVLMLVTSGSAFADPCAEGCRSQHNACRMNAKLLYSPRCDAALQSCLSGCFAQDRFRDRGREGRAPQGFRESPELRGPPEFRGPPAFHAPRAPGHFDRR